MKVSVQFYALVYASNIGLPVSRKNSDKVRSKTRGFE